ncbi:MAG TPA: DUF1318 domain-containing protein [Nitrosomonas halophila]|nr:DUF1318 domain-containing protein [Nitrosomonas halophila]
MNNARIAFLILCALPVTGCITPPDVVMLDRKTVLEEQASGELYALENELRELVLLPKGVDYTRGQLSDAGADLSRTSLSVISEVHTLLRLDSEFLDDLLVRRCVGEARSGLIVETTATCAGRTAARRISATVQRVNRARRQLWEWMHSQQPDRSLDEIRNSWRQHHLAAVVCGGQIEDEDGAWMVKQC